MKHIAILITCFNRKEKTLRCIERIYANKGINEQYNAEIYVVDGGSNDGTPIEIKNRFPKVKLTIGNGLYWAGGMRKAWNEAVLSKQDFDMFLLLNDDTDIYDDCILELLKADEYSKKKYGKRGIYIGSTKDYLTDSVSYGGNTIKDGRLTPNGKYQECTMGNANIMMVSYECYQNLGHLCDKYTHGLADYDYTLRAVENNIPVIITPTYCGTCSNDHSHPWLSQKHSLKERIKFLYSPKGLAYKERLYFNKRFFPKQYVFLWFKLWLKTFFPIIWDCYKKQEK